MSGNLMLKVAVQLGDRAIVQEMCLFQSEAAKRGAT
jgi:hypothetical protein